MENKIKVELTSTEINLIQYVCECIAYGEKIDLNKEGIKIAKRVSQISSNLIMSDDNQIELDEKRKCNCWIENDTCYCEVDKDNSALCGQCQGDKECYCK